MTLILDTEGIKALGGRTVEGGDAEKEGPALMAPPQETPVRPVLTVDEAVSLLARSTGYSKPSLCRMEPATLQSVLGPRGLLDTQEAQLLLSVAPLFRRSDPRQRLPL